MSVNGCAKCIFVNEIKFESRGYRIQGKRMLIRHLLTKNDSRNF